MAPNLAAAPDADPIEAQRLRAELVRRVAAGSPWPPGDVWDPRILQAIGDIPRHLFVPAASLLDAYHDAPFAIGRGQTISQPTVVALMSQALRLSGRERVLEIGTGCGYQTAVLARLAGSVHSIERITALAEQARLRFERLALGNVHVRTGDGHRGWPEEAPFDRVIVTAAPLGVPPALLDQLADGGVLVAPVGDEVQMLARWWKRGSQLEREDLGPVRFVPMLPGVS